MDGEAGDVPAVLMSRVDGFVLDRREVVDAIPLGRRSEAAHSLVAAMAAVHRVDLAETGLAGQASTKPYAQRQLRRWSAQWEASRTRDLPMLDRLTERLWRAVPVQHETTLVHGDPNLRNVILSPEPGAVAAVLDRELSTLSEPLADLGTLFACWPAGTKPEWEVLGLPPASGSSPSWSGPVPPPTSTGSRPVPWARPGP
ncbi:hypothetical protein GCM10027445_10470 [Amycolatopsis endophytica]